MRPVGLPQLGERMAARAVQTAIGEAKRALPMPSDGTVVKAGALVGAIAGVTIYLRVDRYLRLRRIEQKLDEIAEEV